MSGLSFARRYRNTLTGTGTSPGVGAAVRGRARYSFWQRYWASFIGVDLPVRYDVAPVESAAHVLEPGRPARRLPTTGQLVTGWFSLPSLPALAGLRAGDDAGVIAEVATPDGRVEFFVRRGGVASARFRVEVVLREFDALPAIVSIRYGTAEGDQLLLVPMTAQAIGPPAAQVELPGFDGRTQWEASAPVRVALAAAWGADTVVASVHAAANEATRDAWRQVGHFVADELRQVIDRGLS